MVENSKQARAATGNDWRPPWLRPEIARDAALAGSGSEEEQVRRAHRSGTDGREQRGGDAVAAAAIAKAQAAKRRQQTEDPELHARRVEQAAAARAAKAKAHPTNIIKPRHVKPPVALIKPPDGRAERVVQFIEQLIVPSGTGQGKPFRMRAWQRAFIYDVYGPHNATTGFRLVRRAILSMGRKNGKTALIAALVLCHLVGPEAIFNGEIYSAATEREQAAQVYKMASQIVRADEELSAMLKCTDSTKNISCRMNNSFYRALSAEAGTKHGLNPSMVIYDELAQAKNTALYEVLDTSMGARDEPLFVVISTQSNDKQHILSQLIDDGLNSKDPTIVCHLYAVPEDADVYDEEQWILGNPALGDFLKIDDMRAAAAKAKRMPSSEPSFKNLRMNQRVSPDSAMISRAEWFGCEGDAKWKDGEDVVLALDLASVNDLCALAGVSMENKSRVQSWFWKPKDFLEEHTKRDFSGSIGYTQWENEGHLLTTHGKTIDKQAVALHIAELSKRYNIRALAYDRWRIEELLKEFERIDFAAWKSTLEPDEPQQDGLRLVPWGQGFKDMAPAVDSFEGMVMSQDLVHGSHPVLNWNMRNAISISDPAGNRKIDKSKTRFRIDGAVALAMACGLKARMREIPEPTYEMHFL